MNRKEFLRNTAAAAAGIWVMSSGWAMAFRNSDNSEFKRYFAKVTLSPDVKWDETKRIPLGWPVFAISEATYNTSKPVIMKFPGLEPSLNDFYLRITAAIDIREELEIGVFLADSNLEIGCFDIKYAHPFQPFEICLDKKFVGEIGRQGLNLKMKKGENKSWFFLSSIEHCAAPGLYPQILSGVYPGNIENLYDSLYSMNSIAPFGWIGGCVLDALLELSIHGSGKATNTLETQLACFLHDAQGVSFEDTHTRPVIGRFHSIEDLLPFAAIVSLYPEHSSVQMAVDYCLNLKDDNGLIANSNHITSEGCYTVAYPLAKIAVSRNDKELAAIAVKQLELRIDFLSTDNAISQSSYQRSDLTRHTGFDNWGRGITWYLLGIVKTLYVLENSELSGQVETRKAKNEFLRAINWVCKYQDESGMWCSFVDKPQTLADSTATAGLALSIMWGIYAKLLPEQPYLAKAMKARGALRKQLTADGYLGGISQINRGGEDLQKNGYRVISQFGMGLMVQLEHLLEV